MFLDLKEIPFILKNTNIQKKKSEFPQLRYTFTNENKKCVYHSPFTDYWISLKYMLCFSLNFCIYYFIFLLCTNAFVLGFLLKLIILNINSTKFEGLLSPDDLLIIYSISKYYILKFLLSSYDLQQHKIYFKNQIISNCKKSHLKTECGAIN